MLACHSPDHPADPPRAYHGNKAKLFLFSNLAQFMCSQFVPFIARLLPRNHFPARTKNARHKSFVMEILTRINNCCARFGADKA